MKPTMPHPLHLFWSHFRRFFDKYYFLTIYIITRNNIARQYRDSFLGIVWTVLQPTSQLLIYALIMPKVAHFDVQEYVPYLISSLLTWQLMLNVLTVTGNALLWQSETIKRCLVSKTIFPLAEVARFFYTYVVSFIVMYLFNICFIGSFHPTIFLLPLYLLPILIILAAASIALSFLTPYMRDVNDMMLVGMNMAFWLTPVVYPVSAFPAEHRWIFEFNPFYILIRPITSIIHLQQVPSLDIMLPVFGLTIVTVLVCYKIYLKCYKNFIYYL
jgi:ABC-type polysaccharide/polyol phosphate export permease